MSTPPAGWYPDPQDSSRLRYWSGSAWTEHTNAGQQGAATPSASASDGYGGTSGYGSTAGYGGATGYGGASGSQPTSGYGGTTGYTGTSASGSTSGYGGTTGYTGAGYSIPSTYSTTTTSPGSYGSTQPMGTGYSMTPGEPPRRTNPGLIIGIIVVALIVIGGAIYVASQLMGSDDAEPSVPVATLASTPAPQAPAVPDGSSATVLVLNEATPGRVEAGVATAGSLTINTAGLYAIGAVRTGEPTDLSMSLTGQGRTVSADDSPEPEWWWVNPRDPVIATWLEPGEYTVTVSELNALPADFHYIVEGPIDTPDLISNGATDLTITDETSWLGAMQLSEGQSMTVLAESLDGADTILAIQGPDGTVWENDDMSGTSRNSELQLTNLPAGPYAVMVSEYNYGAIEVRLTVTVE